MVRVERTDLAERARGHEGDVAVQPEPPVRVRVHVHPCLVNRLGAELN